MRRHRPSLILAFALSACTEHGSTPMIDASTIPCTVVRFDWNDGTTQGWSASTTASNSGSALVVQNQGNGSLQAFGPVETASFEETDDIAFVARIDDYSSVVSPSELVASFFAYQTASPGGGQLQFSLDFSRLAFGQAHLFTFPVSAGAFTGAMTREAFLAGAKMPTLLLADASFNSNNSTATLDDFLVAHTRQCAR